MKCVILQPSYIPWRGYFHQIALADVFVFYDDVQYDKHGWRNRNRIKTHQGLRWLTIPVHSKGVTRHHLPIKDIRIDWRQPWNTKHWNSIRQAYGKAPHFDRYAAALEAFYDGRPVYLADFTIDLTMTLADMLGIRHTRYLRASDLAREGYVRAPNPQRPAPPSPLGEENRGEGHATDRLIEILQFLGADHYLSGPSASEYLDEEKFRAASIRLEYMTYNYPEYAQLYPPYEPHVSILDLLFMVGPNALEAICAPPREN